MSARGTRAGGSDRLTPKENGTGSAPPKKIIEAIKDATGATEEDITVMLMECNYDVNETTNRLIDSPFAQVQSKKTKRKQKEHERQKDDGPRGSGAGPGSKILEIRRQTGSGGRGRGGRGSGRGRGPGVGVDKVIGIDGADAQTGAPTSELADTVPSSEWGVESVTAAVAAPPPASPPRPAYSRAPGPASSQPAAHVPQPEPIRPSWGNSGGGTMADLFKRSSAPPATQTQLQQPAYELETDTSPSLPVGPSPGVGNADVGLDQLKDHSEGNGTSAMSGLGGLGAASPDQAVPQSRSESTHAQVNGLEGVAVQRPAYQNTMQSAAPGQSVWNTSTAPDPVGSSLMSQLGSSAQDASPALQAALGYPSSSVSQIPTTQSANYQDQHTASNLPASAQSSETERLSLQFGQFGVGNEFGSGFGGSFGTEAQTEASEEPAQGAQHMRAAPAGDAYPGSANSRAPGELSAGARNYTGFGQAGISAQGKAVGSNAPGNNGLPQTNAQHYYSAPNPQLGQQYGYSGSYGYETVKAQTAPKQAAAAYASNYYDQFSQGQKDFSAASKYGASQQQEPAQHSVVGQQMDKPSAPAHAEASSALPAVSTSAASLQQPSPQMYNNPALPPALQQPQQQYQYMPPNAYGYAMPPNAYAYGAYPYNTGYPPQAGSYGGPSSQGGSSYPAANAYANPSHKYGYNAQGSYAGSAASYEEPNASGYGKLDKDSTYAAQQPHGQGSQRDNPYGYQGNHKPYHAYGGHTQTGQYGAYGQQYGQYAGQQQGASAHGSNYKLQ